MPFLDHVSLLERHAKDHDLEPADAVYWVCAFSNRQWDLEADVHGDPNRNSLRRALDRAGRMVSLLDANENYFERIWPWFELWTAQIRGYRHVLYTVLEPRVDDVSRVKNNLPKLLVGPKKIFGGLSMHGSVRPSSFTETERYPEPHEMGDALSRGELYVLIERTKRFLGMRFEDALATEEEDKDEILARVVGLHHLEAIRTKALLAHPRLDEINGAVHGAVLHCVFYALLGRRPTPTDGANPKNAHRKQHVVEHINTSRNHLLYFDHFLPMLRNASLFTLTLEMCDYLPDLRDLQAQGPTAQWLEGLFGNLPLSLDSLTVHGMGLSRRKFQALFAPALTALRKRAETNFLAPGETDYLQTVFVNGAIYWDRSSPSEAWPGTNHIARRELIQERKKLPRNGALLGGRRNASSASPGVPRPDLLPTWVLVLLGFGLFMVGFGAGAGLRAFLNCLGRSRDRGGGTTRGSRGEIFPEEDQDGSYQSSY